MGVEAVILSWKPDWIPGRSSISLIGPSFVPNTESMAREKINTEELLTQS